MPVTQHPPHRSRRAALPHRAPASGRDGQTWRGIRMQDRGLGPPGLCECVQARPWHPVALTTSAQRLPAITPEGVAASPEQTAIARHGLVSLGPQQHACPPGPLLRDGPVHAPPPPVLHGLQCLAEPLRPRLAPDRTLAVPRLTASRRKTAQVAGLRFALSPPLPPFDRKAPTLDESRLLRGQCHRDLPHAFLQFSPEPFGVVPVCEADDEV
jgi:hypothetical protein